MPAIIATFPRESIGWHARRREADISLFTRLLFAAYFLEAGLILVIAPWTNFWNVNVFIERYPSVQEILASPFIRGAVSGVGGITTLAGVAELATAIVARHRHSPPAPNAEL
jgi:ribosomal protein S18 acetylase RimI-like enzyme